MVPIDANSPCGSEHDPALYDFRVRGADGKMYCRVPVVRETLPNGRSYETVELGRSAEDNFGPVTVPADHVWLMGDNRDDSARQPRARMARRARRAGAVGEYRRPRRVHHLLARRHDRNGGTRSAGSRRCARAAPERRSGTADGQRAAPPTTEPHLERPGPAEFRDPLVRREMQKAAVWFGDRPRHRRRDRPRPAAAADRRRRDLRRLPRRRRSAARPIPADPARLAACCWSLLLGFGFIGWVFWFAGHDHRRQAEALARGRHAAVRRG